MRASRDRIGRIRPGVVAGRFTRSRIGSADTNPPFEVSDRALRQRLVRRHLEILVRVANRANQQARVGITGNDRRTALAALEKRRARVEKKSALRLLRASRMTSVALLCEQGTNVRLEVVESGARARFVSHGDRRSENEDRGRKETSGHGVHTLGHPSSLSQRTPRSGAGPAP